MSVINAARGFLADLIDRLAEKVARTDASRDHVIYVAQNHLRDPEPSGGRAIIAKMARAEVKNYLAAIAEAAHVPFTNPEQLIADLSDSAIQRIATTAGFVTLTPAEFESLTSLANKAAGLVYHGPNCPGHTTGVPTPECLEVDLT